MGSDALRSSGLTQKMLYLIRDASLTDADEPLRRVRTSRVILFLAIELAGFGATMAITQTIGTLTIGHSFHSSHIIDYPNLNLQRRSDFL